MILDDGVGDVNRLHVVFEHSLDLQAYKAVSDDGVTDSVSVTFACLHEPNSVPLPGLVVVIRLKSVALKHHGILSGAVYNQLTFAPSP